VSFVPIWVIFQNPVTYHEINFGIHAEWQFFATSHGKAACDGVGGIVKWLVSKASL